MPPRVSVVIPAHNAARWLPDSIGSALANREVPLEVLVVDDGSTDATAAVAVGFGDAVCVLRHPASRGPAAARNTAIAEARGELIAFLDADDRFLPGKLAQQVAVLDARPDVGLVHTAWWFIDDAGRRLPAPGWSVEEGDVAAPLLLGRSVHPVAVMVRRDLVRAAGGLDESLQVNEDWDLFLRLALRGVRWARISEPLCEYRVHDAQSHRRAALVHATRLRILERTLADAALPPVLAPLRAEAFQEASLRGAAELAVAGEIAPAREAFLAAARARPAMLAEPRTYRVLCRLLLPTGQQTQAEAVRHWRAVTRLLFTVVAGALRTPGIEPELARRGGAVRWNLLRAAGRLLGKRVLSSAGTGSQNASPPLG